VPGPNAGPLELAEFGQTINGYEAAGSFERCAEIYESPDWDSVEQLRIALFFLFRSIRHSGFPPDDDEEREIQGLVGRIRELVGKGEPGRCD